MKPQSTPGISLRYFIIPPVLLLSCAALSIGLTFAPCYSSLCVEQFFPYQTRIHIAVFYSLLAGVCLFLAARAVSSPIKTLFERHLSLKTVPLVGSRVSLAGAVLCIWIAGLTLGSIGYWLPTQHTYWTARGALVGWTQYQSRLIWTSVTGHWCDIWVGLVFIPVGRNSVLGRALNLHASSLLLTHKLLAYGLCALSLIHGLLYFSWIAAYSKIVHDYPKAQEFSPDNPTVTWKETKAIGVYSKFTLPTGAVVGLGVIPVMVITALPILRRNNYNTFYFLHLVFAFLVILLVSLHASTSFYFLLPGLLLWVGDWIWRVRYALGTEVEAELDCAGDGWYRVRLPRRIGAPMEGCDVEQGEKSLALQPTSNPLATYYLNVGRISRLEAHPLTAASTGSSKAGPVLLFRRGPEKKTDKKRNREWTWKLGALADRSDRGEPTTLRVRIEGPYSPAVSELYTANHVLAIVGGTGITGALALANWWSANRAFEANKQRSLRLLWTVRDDASSQLEEAEQLQTLMKETPSMEFRVHVSSVSGTMNCREEIGRFLNVQEGRRGNVWVYGSGPGSLLESVETACVEQKRALRSAKAEGAVTALDWYVAKW